MTTTIFPSVNVVFLSNSVDVALLSEGDNCAGSSYLTPKHTQEVSLTASVTAVFFLIFLLPKPSSFMACSNFLFKPGFHVVVNVL